MAKGINSRNKLSRSYKFKKRSIIIQRQKNNDSRYQAKQARIIIRNLSFKATEADIRRLYEPFGQIEEINLLKRPDGTLVGCGFVQFTNITDASKAIFKTNKSEFLGRVISSDWSIPKSQYTDNSLKDKTKKVDEIDITNEKNEENDFEIVKSSENDISVHKSKAKFTKKNTPSKAELRKLQKIKKRQKRSRIIIRNLPFTVTPEAIKESFSKYGNIEELNLLKKPDGTLNGCCFLQFDRVQSAAQAIHYENMKTFLNRSIVVDWAIPKDKFQKSKENASAKTNNNENDVELIKEEKHESNQLEEVKIKDEIDSDENQIKEELDNLEEQNDGNSSDASDNNDDNNSEVSSKNDTINDIESVDDKKDIKLEFDDNSKTPHPRHISNDVNEGKTVFIKNVPFSATNKDLKECMTQFGPVYYALICIDPLTEHSKGTAFVKFRFLEDAEKCLAAGTELKIHDQVLDPHKALHKDELKVKSDEKKKTNKDSRNLYLVKEGVILAGSPAAQDISASDMARRLQLEQWKSQMLRNLNMFVSRVRLVIHNLPANVDNAKLLQLFKNHSNPKAVITEARVMRDLRNVEANGIGKSKEYGFISFTTHEDALKALRSINNNPNIFTKAKRPIVAFSIENRIMVNAIKRRVEKSRQRNPQFNERKRQASNDQTADDKVKGSKQLGKRRKQFEVRGTTESADTDEVEPFAGSTSRAGVKKINSKFFLKKQAQLHSQNQKQRKKDLKSTKQLTMKRKEQMLNRKESKPKQGSKKPSADETNFELLVNKYKSNLSSTANWKTKWYET